MVLLKAESRRSDECDLGEEHTWAEVCVRTGEGGQTCGDSSVHP